MFSFHKHEEKNSIHEVTSEYWEEVLDKIFRKIIPTHNACIAISSNTVKSNNDDKIGSSSTIVIYRFHKRVDQIVHDIVYKINDHIMLMRPEMNY